MNGDNQRQHTDLNSSKIDVHDDNSEENINKRNGAKVKKQGVIAALKGDGRINNLDNSSLRSSEFAVPNRDSIV